MQQKWKGKQKKKKEREGGSGANDRIAMLALPFLKKITIKLTKNTMGNVLVSKG
jgi:hypothetical protein